MKKQILNIVILFFSLFCFAQNYAFTGNRFDDGIYLQWKNLNQKYDQYIIERSLNSNPFVSIARIEKELNQKENQFIDPLHFSDVGIISYRLIGVNNEEEKVLSNFFLENIYERLIKIIPNPTTQGFVLVAIHGVQYEQVSIDVYTPMGETIYNDFFQLTSNKQVQLIDTKNFNHRKKLYLRVQMANTVKIIRLLL